MTSRLAVAFLVLAVVGCAITQEVTPVKLGQPTQDLCLVRNSQVVQDGFHDVYVQVLERKGFRVRSLPGFISTEPELTELVAQLFAAPVTR
jgi:hypothetical protein